MPGVSGQDLAAKIRAAAAAHQAVQTAARDLAVKLAAERAAASAPPPPPPPAAKQSKKG